MPSISYAITACNEHEELERLLYQLDTNIRDIDEVVIQLDTTATEEVKEVCYKYPAFTLIEYSLNGDFIKIYYPDYIYEGKVSFKNDTLIISNKDGVGKYWRFNE